MPPTRAPDADHACDAAPDLLGLDAAIAQGVGLAAPVPDIETLPLGESIGRVLAEAVTSPHPLPPFDTAAMDGYALASADLGAEGPWRLPVAGRVPAGAREAPARPAGTVLRILTGAPVPAGCDAVVMQEHVTRDGDAIRLERRPDPGLNIRRRGEDLAAGAPILAPGRMVGMREAAALAAVGAAAVAVRRRIRVAFFCSGDELVPPGQPLTPGQIYNSNRYLLLAALAAPWIEPRDLGAVRDDPAALTAALRAAAGWADLVVTTGGVSVGEEDHLPRVVTEAGGRLAVVRVAIKPGKPLTLGRIGSAIYLGLPGNPVAAQVGWSLIGARIADRLAGLVRAELPETRVSAGFALRRRPGRAELRPARVTGRDADGRSVVSALPGPFSARIAELAAADGFVLIPAEATEIHPGMALRFLPFP